MQRVACVGCAHSTRDSSVVGRNTAVVDSNDSCMRVACDKQADKTNESDDFFHDMLLINYMSQKYPLNLGWKMRDSTYFHR